MILRTIAAILITCTTVVHARLGETRQECDHRYGPGKDDVMATVSPVLRGAVQIKYTLDGWTIRIAFVDGEAVREEYQKPSSAGGPLFNDYDLRAILTAECGTGTWKVKDTPRTVTGILDPIKSIFAAHEGPLWVRSDGAVGMLLPGKMVVRIASADAVQIEEQFKQETATKQRLAIPKF